MPKRWSDAEIQFVKDNYKTMSIEDMAKHLDKKNNAVKIKNTQLNFGKHWHDAFVYLCYPDFSMIEIAKYLGVDRSYPRNKLKKIKSVYKKIDKQKIKIGNKINQLEILELIKDSKVSTEKIWLCKCSCGNLLETSSHKLYSSRRTRCDNCAVKDHASQIFKGYKDISGTYWGSIQLHAASREIKFNVTIEYCWDIMEKQNHICALTGRKIYLYKDAKNIRNGNASLDRIDSNLSYEEGNLQWVHKDAQRMKMAMKQEKFIETCKEIAEYHKDTKVSV